MGAIVAADTSFMLLVGEAAFAATAAFRGVLGLEASAAAATLRGLVGVRAFRRRLHWRAGGGGRGR